MKRSETLILLCLAALVCGPAAAQEEVQSSLDEAEFVESEIDMEDVMSARAEQERLEREAAEGIPEPVVSVEPQMSAAAAALRETQVIELNQALRNIIEQNSRLLAERDKLEGEIKFLRGQRTVDQNRFKAIQSEMNRVQKQTNEILELNQRYTRRMVELQNTLKTKEDEYQLKIKELQEKGPVGIETGDLALASAPPVPAAAPLPVPAKTRSVEVDVVSMMEQFSQESENLKRDTAKVHYNMGNIFFRKGEYKKASQEYKKVLELVPQDPAAHFNLAFVSGEYLSDPVTALKHYKEYLLLNPDASDAGVVQEKILEANLAVRMLIDSPIDRIPK